MNEKGVFNTVFFFIGDCQIKSHIKIIEIVEIDEKNTCISSSSSCDFVGINEYSQKKNRNELRNCASERRSAHTYLVIRLVFSSSLQLKQKKKQNLFSIQPLTHIPVI